MASFMLLLHEFASDFSGYGPDEAMKIIREYGAWSQRMRDEGRYVAADKLADEPGKVMRPGPNGITVTDGPYSETKEIVGGYYIVTAADYDEACAVAAGHPHLKYGGRIEVRQIHDFS